MKSALILIVAIVALGLGLGYYRGWYSFSRNESATGSQVDLRLTIDKDRVKSDTDRQPAKSE
jgi:hypothetical protein